MQTTTDTTSNQHEAKLISQRVLQTRKEIESLKLQLTKLINDGIKKTDFSEIQQNIATICTDHNKTGLVSAVRNDNNEVDVNKARNFKDSVGDIITPREPVVANAVHSNISLKHREKSPPIQVVELSPKKIRHYDRKAVREYMKMKRKKEQEAMKSMKREEVDTLEVKKQKLQELHQKSLEIVNKNIQHSKARSRSKSRDVIDMYLEACENHENINNDYKDVRVSDGIANGSLSAEFCSNPNIKNITVRSKLQDSHNIPHLDIPKLQAGGDGDSVSINNRTEVVALKEPSPPLPAPTHSLLEKAAIKIQAAFRGHLQRKLYKTKLKHKQKRITKEVQTVEIKKDLPFNLQPNTDPYNFINAVKRKLNLAVKQISNTSMKDVAIQSSLNGSEETKTTPIIHLEEIKKPEKPKKKNYHVSFEETISDDKSEKLEKKKPSKFHKLFINCENEINKEIQTRIDNIVSNSHDENSLKSIMSHPKNTDLKSFLSHKCLNLDVKHVEPLVLIRNSKNKSTKHSKTKSDGLETDSSDTSKNIPDISSESSSRATRTTNQYSIKRAHSSDTDNDNKLKLNTDRVKKLKLLQPRRLTFSEQFGSEEISEHLSVSHSTNKSKKSSKSSKENLNSLKMDNKLHNGSAGRDSIIAYNKCNYSASQNRSDNKNNHKHESKHKIPENNIKHPPKDSLNSFRTYMNNLNNIEQDSREITEELSKSEKSKSKSQETSVETLMPPHEALDDINSEKTKSLSNKTEEYSSNFTSAAPTVPSLKLQSVSLKVSHPISNAETINSHGSIKSSTISLTNPENKNSLKHPTVSLRSPNMETVKDNTNNAITNILLKPGERTRIESKTRSNEIHLKFEAELHLLNEFNDSLRQVMAVEKSLLELHNNKNNTNNSKHQEDKTTTTYHTRDTQTSIQNKSSTDTKISTESPTQKTKSKSETPRVPSINYSRGSEISELSLDNSINLNDTSGAITTGLELSEIKENLLTSSLEESNVDISISPRKGHHNGNVYAGLSLDMFEQLIKDEDARIENLKTILKIREKALVDRTKGELAWLEIQKKHLRDSGQLQEISAIKKKQRGLLIKLEHERHEMQRLKQMQKAASKERKSVLKGQRNMIKAQLSNTSNMITKIKRNTKEEKRQSGPLRVYNIKSHSESIRSETSMSRRSSVAEEIVSVVSHSQSIVSHISEDIITASDKVQRKDSESVPAVSNLKIKTEHVKRTLLMREAALQKRRKAAEELLQWHQRLLEEEGKIAELELAASAIINQVPEVTTETIASDEQTVEKHKFKGSQLNLLWKNMTGREEKKFNDQMTYSMSKVSLERFCKDARKYSLDRNNKSFSYSKKSGKYSDSDTSSAIKTDIDVTNASNIVTELSESKRKSKGSGSSSTNNSEKSKKSKPSNSIVSDIKISKDDQFTDYTSDFESVLSIDKLTDSIRTEEEVDEDKDTTIPDEISITENEDDVEPETIAEVFISKQLSKTEIIDQESSPKKESQIDNEVNEMEIITESSELNRNATSRDISTDIEYDEEQEINNLSFYEKQINNINENIFSEKISVINDENNLFNIQFKSIHTKIEDKKISEDSSPIRTEASEVSLSEHLNKPEEISEANEISIGEQLKKSEESSQLSSPIKTEASEISLSEQLNKPEEISEASEISISNQMNKLDEISDILEETNSRHSVLKTIESQLSMEKLQDASKSHKAQPEEHLNSISEQSQIEAVETEDECVDIEDTSIDDNTDEERDTEPSQIKGDITNEQLQLSKISEIEDVSKVSEIQDDSKISEIQVDSKTDESAEVSDLQTNNKSSEIVSTEDKPSINKEVSSNSKSEHSTEISADDAHLEIKDEEISTETSYRKLESPRLLSYGFIDNKEQHEDAENTTSNQSSDILSDKRSEKQEESLSEVKDDTSNKMTEEIKSDKEIQALEKIKSDEEIETTEEFNNDTEKIGLTEEIRSDAIQESKSVEETETIASDEELEMTEEAKSIKKTESTDKSKSDKEIETTEEIKSVKEIESAEETKSNREMESIEETKSNKQTESIEEIKSDREIESIEEIKSDREIESIEEVKSDREIAENKSDQEIESIEETKHDKETTQKKSLHEGEHHIDVKKRVSEILADANISSPREDKSPRLQDLYQTAYDVASSEHSSDSGSPTDEPEPIFRPLHAMYTNDEVEELLKKQLEIEQEIKEIQQQQQKEHIPYLYVREIPNKPPPPYTPPVSTQTITSESVLPASEKHVAIVTSTVADILHKAYLNNNLQNATLSSKDIKFMQTNSNVENTCFEFVFDLCKEAAIDHYKLFETETGPSWMRLTKQHKLAMGKPFDKTGLEKSITTKVRQWLGYETVKSTENIKCKWSGKKRDHVDELLVVECQGEEAEWTNYDRDELFVKDELTKDIMNMLLSETAQVLSSILNKKAFLC